MSNKWCRTSSQPLIISMLSRETSLLPTSLGKLIQKFLINEATFNKHPKISTRLFKNISDYFHLVKTSQNVTHF